MHPYSSKSVNEPDPNHVTFPKTPAGVAMSPNAVALSAADMAPGAAVEPVVPMVAACASVMVVQGMSHLYPADGGCQNER